MHYLNTFYSINADYTEKQQSGKCSDKFSINLAWKIKELGNLNESGRKLIMDVGCFFDKLQDEHCNWKQKTFHVNLQHYNRGG